MSYEVDGWDRVESALRDKRVLFLVRNSKAKSPAEKVLSLYLAERFDIEEDSTEVTAGEIMEDLGFSRRTVSNLNSSLEDWKVEIIPGSKNRYTKKFEENIT